MWRVKTGKIYTGKDIELWERHCTSYGILIESPKGQIHIIVFLWVDIILRIGYCRISTLSSFLAIQFKESDNKIYITFLKI